MLKMGGLPVFIFCLCLTSEKVILLLTTQCPDTVNGHLFGIKYFKNQLVSKIWSYSLFDRRLTDDRKSNGVVLLI